MRPTPALRMQATRILRANHLDPKNGVYMGNWGDLALQSKSYLNLTDLTPKAPKHKKGIISYSMSPNRQAPLAGAARAAIFNTARRTSHQILYWLPPMVLGYALMEWAIERNEYLNSKPGREETGGAA